jgi:hypothetical protein
MKKTYFVIFLFISVTLSAQQVVHQTFKDTRVINSHSTETLPAGKLDFRIGHRFGDLAGDLGGWPTFYGLENASDVLIGFEYGLKDNLMIGLSRTKGAGELRQNINGLIKVKLMAQEVEDGKPFSLVLVGLATGSTIASADGPGTLAFFEKAAHRLSYHSSFIIAKKFSNRFSIQINGAWTYRNLVPSEDKNDLVSVGLASRIQLTKSLGLLLDANFLFSELRTTENGFYNPTGFGLEWETGGGHVFQINFTNAKGLSETDFLPNTKFNWADGEFRLGFTISRQFTVR